jgi:hypothetical protein
MQNSPSRFPAILALVGSVLGLAFATYSTLDYSQHLDRGLHDLHCSFIPGMPPSTEAEACRAAMYSPYSALFKEAMWGGIPISLFAIGAMSFFAGFAVYLLAAHGRASRASVSFFGVVSIAPVLVSLLMFIISLTKVGSLCKTCVGIYIASILIGVGGIAGLFSLEARPSSQGKGLIRSLGWLVGLGTAALIPAAVYAASVPDQRPYLTRCGELKQAEEAHDALLKIRSSRSIQPTVLFEDPLCPTCKAFHSRLLAEDVFDKLDVKLVLFPLDSSCNWMLDEALHPGACVVSKAVLCGGDQARQVLEWAYDQQVYLTRAGKTGENVLKEVIRQRWGDALARCVDDRDTTVRLNRHLHYASDNGVPVSTPQVYLGKRRMCDEDTDIGLRFTLKQLAPEVLK